jgi:RNA polymerase sigma factor for flagellar operon FliA
MNDAEKKALWEKYAKEKSADIREKLIIEYVPLV